MSQAAQYKAGIKDSGLFRSPTRGEFVASYRHMTTVLFDV